MNEDRPTTVEKAASRPTLNDLLEESAIEIDYITATMGRTINLGNYESLRLDVRLGAKVAEGIDLRTVLRVLHEECDTELDRQEQYHKAVDKARDWFGYSRTLEELQARRTEIAAGDSTWHAKDQLALLSRADEAIQKKEKDLAKRAREHGEDLVLLAGIIEDAKLLPAGGEPVKGRWGHYVTPWEKYLQDNAKDLHSNKLTWETLTQAQWAAATPEDLLAGVVPEVQEEPAPEVAQTIPETIGPEDDEYEDKDDDYDEDDDELDY